MKKKVKYNIPRTMSTQHPDNVRTPIFSASPIIGLNEEIKEVDWIMSLGCQEQLWDFEGKITLPGVVSEIIARNQEMFKERPLGKKFFLTFRIPNSDVEKGEAKLVPEILESIPRSYDVAQGFYQDSFPPIFEVILPMATSVKQLNRIYDYYRNFVVGKERALISPGDITVAQWLGEFQPKNISVIPLFEDKDSLLNADKIVAGYLVDKKVDYQRVFLARSDPALNYGNMAAVLLLNVALQRLDKLEEKIKIPIYPILGVGSAPFRGNFRPDNVASMLKGYASCQTFTLQSAFKYDWPLETVAAATKKINSARRGKPVPVDEKKAIRLIEKTAAAYQEQIPEIAVLANRLTPFVPRRRLRKLHIGLFGYSRNAGGVRLPRAISFCASLYSIGLPPEILGLHCLNSKDFAEIKEVYPDPNFKEDLKSALAFYNPAALTLLSPKMQKQIQKVLRITNFQTNAEHQKITSQIIHCLQDQQTENLPELIAAAGRIRRFLG